LAKAFRLAICLIAGTYFIRVQTGDAKEFNFKIVKE